MNDVCNGTGNEKYWLSGTEAIWCVVDWNTSVLRFIIFFNLFASIRRLLCFSSLSLSRSQSACGFIVFQMKTYISRAPLLLSDGWMRGDHKQGDTERVSGAFSSFLFSPHSANVQFPLTAWHALVSPSLSSSSSSLGHYTLISCSLLPPLLFFLVSLPIALFPCSLFITPSATPSISACLL